MKSKLSGIFQVELFAKYILCLGAQGPDAEQCYVMLVFFILIWREIALYMKKHTNVLNQTVRIQCFPC